VNIHAGLVALRLGGLWRGALILGPSGSGKSDLALRLLAEGLRLVADDRAIVWACGGRLYGRAPDVLRGRIEARGLAVLHAPAVAMAQVALAVRCEPKGAELERLTGEETESFEGVAVPLLRLRALEASAPAKLRRALLRLGTGAGAP
jgi:serine kinase of HPr protein (carbohydrate metabolism regulator)